MHREALDMGGALEGLATQVATQPRRLWRQLEIGLLAATLGIMFRVMIDPVVGDHLPFSTFFPALLVAGVFGGAPGGALALAITTLGGWFLFLPERMSWRLYDGQTNQILVYAAIGAFTVGLAVVLRGALIRLESHRRRNEALVGELHHRLRKDLSVIAAIATQTLRASPEPAHFRRAFVDRLAVLRETHAALWSEDWQAMSLARIVARPLKLFAPSESARILLEGPDVAIHPDLAMAFALCIWELAANAVRHGALSTAEGRVRAQWTLTDGRIDFAWIETGGPPRLSEAQKGFGFELLERGLGEGLCWRSEWLPGLLRWSVAFARDGAALPPNPERATEVVPAEPPAPARLARRT